MRLATRYQAFGMNSDYVWTSITAAETRQTPPMLTPGHLRPIALLKG